MAPSGISSSTRPSTSPLATMRASIPWERKAAAVDSRVARSTGSAKLRTEVVTVCLLVLKSNQRYYQNRVVAWAEDGTSTCPSDTEVTNGDHCRLRRTASGVRRG